MVLSAKTSANKRKHPQNSETTACCGRSGWCNALPSIISRVAYLEHLLRENNKTHESAPQYSAAECTDLALLYIFVKYTQLERQRLRQDSLCRCARLGCLTNMQCCSQNRQLRKSAVHKKHAQKTAWVLVCLEIAGQTDEHINYLKDQKGLLETISHKSVATYCSKDSSHRWRFPVFTGHSPAAFVRLNKRALRKTNQGKNPSNDRNTSLRTCKGAPGSTKRRHIRVLIEKFFVGCDSSQLSRYLSMASYSINQNAMN